MVTGRSHTEKTSAADKSSGFDFQYYYFLWRLLTLKDGESVGLEVMDDVHTELNNSRQILIQLKHTIQTKQDGSAKNITTFDPDLWKSLSNWSKVIADPNAGRATEKNQIVFVEKTDFLLASNKNENEANTIIMSIKAFTAGDKSHEDLKNEISRISNTTKDKNIKEYIKNILSLTDNVSKIFFKNINFDLGCDDIINKCKTAIKEKMIKENHIESVFSSVDSRLRSEIFISTKKKEKAIFSFDDIYKIFRVYYDRTKNDDLVINRFSGELPAQLEKQKFIQQLVDIQDILPDDIESMAKFTRHLLHMRNNIDEWYKNGELTEKEINDFRDEAVAKWENEFHKAYRGLCLDHEITKKALDIVDALRKENLPLALQNMSTEISNGQFYHLSDLLQIGWHKEWLRKY